MCASTFVCLVSEVFNDINVNFYEEISNSNENDELFALTINLMFENSHCYFQHLIQV